MRRRCLLKAMRNPSQEMQGGGGGGMGALDQGSVTLLLETTCRRRLPVALSFFLFLHFWGEGGGCPRLGECAYSQYFGCLGVLWLMKYLC